MELFFIFLFIFFFFGGGGGKEMLQDIQLSISLKKQVVDQCVLPTITYDCQA